MSLPWKYCECGCKSHVIEVGNRQVISLFNSLRPGPRQYCITFQGQQHFFETGEEVEAKALELLYGLLGEILEESCILNSMLQKERE